MVLLAGLCEKYSPYIWLTILKSSIFERKIVVFTTFSNSNPASSKTAFKFLHT
jgi:hypothetical protein